MATVGSRDFQIGYQKLTEVTRVEARGKYLGTWYPAGTEPMALGTVEVLVSDTQPVIAKMSDAQKIIDMQEDEIRQLKRTIAAQAIPNKVGASAVIADRAFTTEFRPVPKPGKAK